VKKNLIVPCGMNCGICIGFLRDKNKCPGCRNMENKPVYCRKCIIKNCKILKQKEMQFCSDKCEKYPCKRLKGLDKRYKTKYKMRMIENLENIKELGIRNFLKKENEKWKCKACDNILCVHRNFCLNCGKSRF